MNYSNMYDYRPFDFWDMDPYIELCFDLAFEKLRDSYPNNLLFSSDCFGISVIDATLDDCKEMANYTTGRLGTAGPLAMRNELTGEVAVLCQN